MLELPLSDVSALREQFLRASPLVRLGGLADHLARIRTSSTLVANREVTRRLLHESQRLAEWTVPEVPLDKRAALRELRHQLERWERLWDMIWEDPLRKGSVVRELGRWSERIHAMSGRGA